MIFKLVHVAARILPFKNKIWQYMSKSKILLGDSLYDDKIIDSGVMTVMEIYSEVGRIQWILTF